MENVKKDIKDLLETICEMGEYTEISDIAYIGDIANRYGFTINEDIQVERLDCIEE